MVSMLISMIVYFCIISVVNVSILHFIISLFYKYKPKHSLKTLLVDVLFIYKIFIMLLPFSLLLSILPSTFYRMIFAMVILCLSVYYIYHFCLVINVNVKLEAKSQAMFLLVVIYMVSNVMSMMLIVSNVAIFTNIISSFVL